MIKKIVTIVFLIGLAIMVSGKVSKTYGQGITKCCYDKGDTRTPNCDICKNTGTCQNIPNNCGEGIPPAYGSCYCTGITPLCTGWDDWANCKLDTTVNRCYETRYCTTPSWLSYVYQIRLCTCSQACTASCSTNCGQADGCGGTCGSTDAGVPTAPVLSPSNGGTVTVTSASPNVRASWSAPSKADSYELELYPAGTNCVTSGAYCNPPSVPILTSLFYSYLPQYPSYYYRVRALNSTCSTEYSTWASATFNVRGTISGQVKEDGDGSAVLVGGVCQLVGASGIQPGVGSVVTVDGVDSGAVGATGLYTLNTALGSSKIAVLTCCVGVS